MKSIFKTLLFALAAVILLVVVAMFGMPGPRDGELHLAGKYYFTHSGGFQNAIAEERDGRASFVTHMKVEEFIVQGDDIFVSRRPVVDKSPGNNRSDHQLSDTCLYYRIDVAENKVYGPFMLAEVRNCAE